MAINYKRNSKKLYKLTFMSVFCVQVPWEKKKRFWTFLKACATRVHETEVLKHGCWFGGSGAGCCKAIGRARLAKFSVPTAENPWLSDVNTKKSKGLGKHGMNPAASTAKNKTQCARGLLAGTGELELLGVRKARFWSKRVCVLLKYEKKLANAYVFGDRTQLTRMCLLR
jgi:hypothetical protein